MTMAIHEYTQRPKRAAEADGLNDTVGGVTLLAITFMWYANQHLSATFHGHDFQKTLAFKLGLAFFLFAVAAMFAVILFSKRVAASLRERFVYPRLGYSTPVTVPAIRYKILLIAASLGMTLIIDTVSRSFIAAGAPLPLFNSGTLIALLGVFYGASYFYHFAKLGFVRHLVLGGVALLVALALSLAKLDDITAIRAYTVVLGVSLMLAGTVTFTQLLRQPLITAPEDDAE